MTTLARVWRLLRRAALLTMLAAPSAAHAQQLPAPPALAPPPQPRITEKYVDEDGLRYRITTRIVPRQVISTEYKTQTRSVQRPKFSTDKRQVEQQYYVPVTRYESVPVMRGRWNPFIEPYYEQRYVQVTHWELQTRKVDIPVARQDFETATETVNVPVTTQRWVDEEFVSRQVVGAALGTGGPSGSTAAASTAQREDTTTRRDMTAAKPAEQSLKGQPTPRGNGANHKYD
jgi:hypothetical protein